MDMSRLLVPSMPATTIITLTFCFYSLSVFAVDLEKATKLISQVKIHQSRGKTAFVMPKDDFSLGVLFEGLTKIENLPREYRSFTSHEEAERWLEQHCRASL